MRTAAEALEALKSGNKRFVAELQNQDIQQSGDRQYTLVAKQQRPFAIVIGCSDSRVPAEIVFDQGIGDLFVIRVAGNVVAPLQIGSVEFAAQQFGTPLVIVMGHSRCGAVEATLAEIDQPSGKLSPNLQAIVECIRPAVETGLSNDPQKRLCQAIRANIIASIDQLKRDSKVLEELVREEKLLLVGAEYSLDTGEVEFFD